MADNLKVNWNELIKLGGLGIEVADFPDIKNAIQARFKEIYGDDIDLTNTTADGVYIETYSLIINNILQSFKRFYSELDVSQANGKFLERLCALSNVYRKPASKSSAYVYLKLLNANQSPYTTDEIDLIDKSGKMWICQANPGESLTLNYGEEEKPFLFEAEEVGPITAPAGWINQLVSQNVSISINQKDPAELGAWQESDLELRQRRNNFSGSYGMTVLENLAGSLLRINGVEDVKIYNNDSLSDITAKDNTVINPHSIYLILKKNKNVQIDNSLIGSNIYEEMTPGIHTTQYGGDGTDGVNKNYNYQQQSLGIAVTTGLAQQVYWKEAIPFAPKITLNIVPTNAYAFNEDSLGDKKVENSKSTSYKIVDAIIKLLNNKKIGSDILYNELYETIKNADPQFRGNPTFSISTLTIGSTTSNIYISSVEPHSPTSTSGGDIDYGRLTNGTNIKVGDKVITPSGKLYAVISADNKGSAGTHWIVVGKEYIDLKGSSGTTNNNASGIINKDTYYNYIKDSNSTKVTIPNDIVSNVNATIQIELGE